MSWREHRLSRRADYAAVFAGRRRIKGALVELLVLPNALGRARLGMAVSRSRTGNAVGRNRIKRMIREGFRSRLTRIASLDCLAILRSECATHAQARVAAAEFAELLDRFAAVGACRQ